LGYKLSNAYLFEEDVEAYACKKQSINTLNQRLRLAGIEFSFSKKFPSALFWSLIMSLVWILQKATKKDSLVSVSLHLFWNSISWNHHQTKKLYSSIKLKALKKSVVLSIPVDEKCVKKIIFFWEKEITDSDSFNRGKKTFNFMR